MNRELSLDVDITSPTIKVDTNPGFKGMEQAYGEIELFKGDNASINFTVTQNGSAFNLSGYTVKYQAKAAIGDAAFVFDKTATITDASNGKCRVDLAGSDIDEAETLQTQLYLTQNGTTQTVLQIPLTVLPSV